MHPDTTIKQTVAASALLLMAPLALAGPPFITDDPEPVDLGHWEVYAFSAGAVDNQAATGFGPALEVNYGAAPDTQLHVIVPIAYGTAAGTSSQVGLGDTELGVKYRFVTPGENDWWPEIGTFPLLEIPTGNAARGLGAGYTQTFLPIWLQKNIGKWTTYGGGGYWTNPGPGNRNFWFTGWLLQYQVTDALALGGELFHQTSSMVGRAASSGFNLGGIYDLNEHHHLLFSAGRGGMLYAVNAASVINPFTYYLGFQWTF